MSRTSRLHRALATAFLAVSLLGCQPGPASESSPSSATEGPAAAATVPAISAVAPPGLTPETAGDAAENAVLDMVDRAGFEAALARLRGQVVLVDFWATWCTPCREQMRHTALLVERYGDQGLAGLSLSLDEPDDEQSLGEAREFLAGLETRFRHLLSAQGGSDAAYDAFAIDNGAIPHLQLFDRQGRLVRKFSSGDPTGRPATSDEIEAAVRAALGVDAGEAGAATAPLP